MTAPQKKAEKALIITESCPVCKDVKDFLKEKGLADKVKLINASTPEGRKFALDHGITGVPECVILEPDGKQVRVCTKEEFEKVLTEGS